MDSILLKPVSQIVMEQNNNKIYEISYNKISKIQPSSMISPSYFKKVDNEEKIILNEQKLKDNKYEDKYIVYLFSLIQKFTFITQKNEDPPSNKELINFLIGCLNLRCFNDPKDDKYVNSSSLSTI